MSIKDEYFKFVVIFFSSIFILLILSALIESFLKGINLIYGVIIFIPFIMYLFYKLFQYAVLPISYDVAILGFERSGKTTLITSLFREAFAHKLKIRMIPKGDISIELVNKYIKELEKGQSLGPTTIRDRFGFRADITFKKLIPINYKVEFGDFSGVDTEKYSLNDDDNTQLFDREFFKWVAYADSIIFVIDLGQYLKPNNRDKYILDINTSFRKAWQKYLDSNSYREKEARNIPIILLFNKFDLFNLEIKYMREMNDNIEDDNIKLERAHALELEIMALGFGERVPEIKEINPEILKYGKTVVQNDFFHLIQYFEEEAPNLKIIFTSSFGLLNGKRLEFDELIRAIFK